MSGPRLLAAVVGFWLLMRSLTKDDSGRTLIDHVLGNNASQSPLLNMALPAGFTPSYTGPGLIPSDAPRPNTKGQVNPVPGATGNRLDQGFDVTAKEFLAPFTGKIVAASQMEPGWGNGGDVAIQNATDPNQVVFFAEGISPVVAQGENVVAGQRIGIPRKSPYPTGGFGSIEIGPANPRNPRQPLAQVVSNKAGVVNQFYSWLRALGGPKATSTSLAGHA